MGIRIPPSTVFVPFHHYTTTDLVEALDERLVPLFARDAARSVHESLSAAARESAVERCRRLALGTEGLSAERAFQPGGPLFK